MSPTRRAQDPIHRESGSCGRRFRSSPPGSTPTNCTPQPQDAIDLTDNDIALLSNFPLSPRLQTLLLARNRVNSIQPNLAANLPNLTNLVLTANNMAELADLDPLQQFQRLTHLSLLENPVARKEVRTLPAGSLERN